MLKKGFCRRGLGGKDSEGQDLRDSERLNKVCLALIGSAFRPVVLLLTLADSRRRSSRWVAVRAN